MSTRRLVPAAALVVVSLVATLLVAGVAVEFEGRRADARAEEGARRVAEITRLGVVNSSGSMADTAGLFDASDEVTARDFETFARRVLGRGPLAELRWLERVDATARAGYEARTGADITEPAPVGVVRAPARPVHHPIRFVTSEIPTGAVHGRDDSRDPLRGDAMRRAAALDTPIVTPPVELHGTGGLGLLLYQPVYAGGRAPAAPGAREAAVRGFVVGSFGLDALTRRIIGTAGAGTPVEIRDGDRLLSDPAPGAADGARVELPVAGRRWTILAARPAPSWGLPIVILAAGSVLTALALALAIVIARRDRFATAAVGRATAELRESRRSHQALAENSPDIIARYDRDLRCTFVNTAITAAIGLPVDAVLGRTGAETGAPADVVGLWEGGLRQVLAGEEEVEVDFAYPSADRTRWFHSRLAPERDEQGVIEHVLVVTRDVTRQVRTERALRASQERYRTLIGSLSDGVLVADGSGAVVSCNPAAEAILGRGAAQLTGRPAIDPEWRPIGDDDRPFPHDADPARSTLLTGRPRDGVVVGVHRPDGSLVWLSVSTRALEEDGRRSVVCCLTDVTARIQTGREQAALRRVATLVAGDAEPPEVHELVAREAAALTGAEAAGVIRFDTGGRYGIIVGAHAPGRTPGAPGGSLDLSLPTAVARVAATGEAARVGVGRPGHPSVIVPGAAVTSAVAVPIRVDNRLWGALTAATTRSGETLPPGTGERLARLGELVALAIMSSEARTQLATLATTDHLTGLTNRRAFTERLAAEIDEAARSGGDVSLALLDIDHFKRVNDTHGHPAGDVVLQRVAREMLAVVRERETVARIGGEEFGWILPGTGGEAAVLAAERLRSHLGGVTFEGVGTLTLSMGLCDLRDASDAHELLRLADAALYRAKEAGRDRVVRHVASPRAGAPGAAGTRS